MVMAVGVMPRQSVLYATYSREFDREELKLSKHSDEEKVNDDGASNQHIPDQQFPAVSGGCSSVASPSLCQSCNALSRCSVTVMMNAVFQR